MNSLQLGCSAEYLVTLHFLLHGYNVYRAVVDDHGVDLLVRHTNSAMHYEVQVKSCRDLNYIFFRKDKFVLRDNLLAAVVLFLQGKQPTGRFVSAQSVTDLLIFLCGPVARDMTGAILPVEAGWLAS